MARPARKFAMRACAAAVCCAFSLGAMGQAGVEQVQVGLERASKTPLEILLLRADVQEEAWRNDPTLAAALQACTKTGAPREGCNVNGRTYWRFNLASNLVVSAPGAVPSLRAASGRVLLVEQKPETTSLFRLPAGRIVLAAGSTVHLVDAAFPAILVEVKAPDAEALPLGNLGASDIGKVVALLVKPGTVSASAAAVADGGRIVLHSGDGVPRPGAGEILLAAISPASGIEAPTKSIAAPPAKVEDASALATLDLGSPAVASLDLAPRVVVAAAEPGLVLPSAFAAAIEAYSKAKTEDGAWMLAQELGSSPSIASLDVAPRVVVAAAEPSLVLPGAFAAAIEAYSKAKIKDGAALATLDLASPAVAALDLSPRITVATAEPSLVLPGAFAAAIEAYSKAKIGDGAWMLARDLESSPSIASLDVAPRVVVAAAEPSLVLPGAFSAAIEAYTKSIAAAPEKLEDASALAALDLASPAVASLELAPRVAVAAAEPVLALPGAFASAIEASSRIANMVPEPQPAERITVAAVEIKPAPVARLEAPASPAPSTEVARLRAEIEAEIARENQRLAGSLPQPSQSAKRFRLGV